MAFSIKVNGTTHDVDGDQARVTMDDDEDYFPALFADTYPLPAETPLLSRGRLLVVSFSPKEGAY